ncbi:MAG: AAA domain-containing protein [Bacteroidia bacterium]|nr:AAA domain-containing protein [Bacteroidia bacterium]MDW8333319.1 AAA domain-containing protein [Bacteroidia bacterium]
MNAEALAWEWVRARTDGAAAHEWMDLLQRAVHEATENSLALLPDVYARVAYLKRSGLFPPPLIALIYATLARLNEALAADGDATLAPQIPDAVGEIVLALAGNEARAVCERTGVFPAEGAYSLLAARTPKADARKLYIIVEKVENDQLIATDRRGETIPVLFRNKDCLAGKTLEFWFRPGDQILFHRLENLGENRYATNEDTLAILEPDYLINVTDMAEAAAQSSSADMIRRYYNLEPPRLSLLVGSMANTMLDEWLCQPHADFEDVLKGAFRQHAFTLAFMHLCGGTGGDFSQTVGELKSILREHAKTLQALAQRLHEKELRIWIEPSRISPDFGLQGRMDVLLTDDGRPEYKTIIELKSGKPPKIEYESVRPEHLYQLTGYDLQLGDAKRVGNSCVFYSQETDLAQAMRTVFPNISAKRTALAGRNRLVRSEFRLCEDDYSELEAIREKIPDDVPKYKTTDAAAFHETLAGLTDIERAYFYAFSGFVAREHRHAKIGVQRDGAEGAAGLWRKTLPQKCADHSAIADLEPDLLHSDPERGYYRFLRRTQTSRMPASFRPDDYVVLYDQTTGPVESILLKATLVELDDEKLTISLRNKQIDAQSLLSGRIWAMEHDFLEKTDKALYQNLFRWAHDGDAFKRRIFLGLERPRFAVSQNLEAPPYLQRAEQIDLFRRALGAQDYFLIQGPPGTGKTSLLLKALAEHLYHRTNQNVAFLAYTNRAADEICEQLLSLDVPFFRLGFCRMENVPTEKQLSHKLSLRQIHDFLADVRFVVSTVSSFAGRLNEWSFKKFHTAIIDEASQLLEPHVCGILTRFERFVLIGDEKQLPAVVSQPESGHAPPPALRAVLAQAGIHNLARAVFDRILSRCREKGWDEAYGMLTAQGRMHRDPADFVSRRFYDGRLQIATQRQTRPFTAHPRDSLLARSRLLFVNVPTENAYKINRREAALAAQIVERIRGETGVIAPFRAQIAEIVRRLDPEIRRRTTVDTVERYQGSQRDFIVYSVCANFKSQIPLLSSPNETGTVDRKLNVALTRAKEQVVVLGNAEVLSADKHYAALIEYAMQNNGYIEAEDLEKEWRQT